jgi:hypothetical protein
MSIFEKARKQIKLLSKNLWYPVIMPVHSSNRACPVGGAVHHPAAATDTSHNHSKTTACVSCSLTVFQCQTPGHEHEHSHEHGHTHEVLTSPGAFLERDAPKGRQNWAEVLYFVSKNVQSS